MSEVWVSAIGAVASAGGAYLANKKSAPGAVYQAPVDIGGAQKDAITSNLTNESSIEALLTKSNAFQQNQATSLLEQAMPGFGNLQKALTTQATEAATNPYDVPKDVENYLKQVAAENGVSAGTRGEFNKFSLTRDLGVNALEYGTSRLNQASQLTSVLSAVSPRINPASPLSFFVSPNAAISAQAGINVADQAVGQGAANAASSVANNNQAALWNGISQGFGSLFSSFAGSGGTKKVNDPGVPA